MFLPMQEGTILRTQHAECPPPRQGFELQGGNTMHQFISNLRDESGQTMAEYAVVLGVITIAVVVTLGLLGTAIQGTLTNVIASL
jgi:Flp pilus assembly pilin Flp